MLPSRQTPPHARIDRKAPIRPSVAAAMFGGLLGLAVGGAYLGGTAAKASSVRDQAQRIDIASSAGFTEEALAAAAGGLDASALAIARRHDPYTVAGGARRDRQAELMTARLEQLRIAPASSAPSDLRQISLTGGTDAARPFRLSSALDASRDLECLTQVAYYEARGEGRDGMQAVTQVVLNRVRHPAFPKTVCGVVFQGAGRRTGCQFSFTCDGSMRGAVNRGAWDRARDVASKALSGAVHAGVGNATHFHTTNVSPGWRNALVRVNQVGNHLFYRFGGRSGSSAAFQYNPRPSPLLSASLTTENEATSAASEPGQVIAYTALLAQEGRTTEASTPIAVSETRPTPPPVAIRVSTAAAPAQAAPPSPAAASPVADAPATPITRP